MFIAITPIKGSKTEQIAKAAADKGLKYGEVVKGSSYGKPALSGNTYSIKETLKAHGARFDGLSKVWYFDSTEQAEAAIAAI